MEGNKTLVAVVLAKVWNKHQVGGILVAVGKYELAYSPKETRSIRKLRPSRLVRFLNKRCTYYLHRNNTLGSDEPLGTVYIDLGEDGLEKLSLHKDVWRKITGDEV